MTQGLFIGIGFTCTSGNYSYNLIFTDIRGNVTKSVRKKGVRHRCAQHPLGRSGNGA